MLARAPAMVVSSCTSGASRSGRTRSRARSRSRTAIHAASTLPLVQVAAPGAGVHLGEIGLGLHQPATKVGGTGLGANCLLTQIMDIAAHRTDEVVAAAFCPAARCRRNHALPCQLLDPPFGSDEAAGQSPRWVGCRWRLVRPGGRSELCIVSRPSMKVDL